MKRLLPLLLLLLSLSFSPFFLFTSSSAPLPPNTPPALEDALQTAIAEIRDDVLAFLLYDVKINHTQFDRTGTWAVLWLDLYDPATGQLVPTEPGLVVAHDDGARWHIILQADPAWADALTALPPDLMPEGNKALWLTRYHTVQAETPTTALDGYLLPWAGGLTKILTRSITHGGTGYYAFDFGDGTMFPLYASKGGIVHMFEWTYPNGFDDGSCAHSNYLILEDPTTTPTTYQLYLHLAYDSIPENLRTIGTPVLQGQFIGNADDTGCSTGHHLHFQVHTNPNYYWGTALDITFDDVDINSGRPRTPPEASDPACTPAPCTGRWNYTSQNTIVADFTAPTGSLTAPTFGATITQTAVALTGWALDEGSGVDTAYFQANVNNTWVQVGPLFTTFTLTDTISYTWDWCAANVPNGPVSLALHVEDEDGNLSDLLGLRHVLKNSTCTPPPPACTPAADQIALFTEPNYAGECVTLNPGVHLITTTVTGLSTFPLPNNFSPVSAGGPVASILAGNAARVTLYRELLLRGRAETFYASDPNLADNWSGTEEIMVAVVAAKTEVPNPPVLAWPLGDAFPGGASVSLVWDDGGGAAEFQVQYAREGNPIITSAWQAESILHLGSLAPGLYNWQVRARNANGVMSGWGAANTFTVAPAPAPPASVTYPYTTGFENVSDWQMNGQWNLLDHAPAAHGGTFTAWYGTGDFDTGSYDTGAPNAGDLTSPPIPIPGTGTPYLRFYSWYVAEPGTHWDQRWVQISADGGPFTNTYQMTGDPASTWVQSPFIDLAPYVGQTIRIRFHFETLDARYNGFRGWLIDDLQVADLTPPTCAPDESGTLTYGDAVSGVICPAGDEDVFSFTGSAGDHIGVNVDAQTVGSSLDSYLYLLADDGTSVVAENDDEVPFTLTDSLLNLTLPWDGTYFLKLRAWDHPGAGGTNHFYTMTLSLDPDAPTLSNLSPVGSPSTNFFVQADTVIPVTVSASDVGTGIERVDFYFHAGDWANGSWTLLGTDTDGTDGWSLPGGWDTTPLADQLGMALVARAVDRAGNISMLAAWNLALDRVPPQTTVVALPPVLDTSAMLIEWSSTDNIAPIREFDIQWQINNGAWTDYQMNVISATRQMWVIGELGTLYGFRVRAVDEAGNLEPYNNGTNLTTTFLEPCDEPDEWEGEMGDNAAGTASVYASSQTHNFCNLADEDWAQVTLEVGKPYFITTSPIDPSAAVVIEIYAEDGTTLLEQVYPQDPNGQPATGTASFGLSTLMIYQPSASGTYYLRLYHPMSEVVGAAVRYTLVVNSYQLFVPVIFR
ncbi:MAG: pre-peptidase C-terminal domain-containing protein [Anaerolineales bacterium]|nr:pre-peptidase C-terminal domain-containing protein [Anaerolineales bacterium]